MSRDAPFKASEQVAHGTPTVADGVFLLRRQLGQRTAERGDEEDGIVTEALRPGGPPGDLPEDAAPRDYLRAVREGQAERADEVGAPRPLGHLAQALQ